MENNHFTWDDFVENYNSQIISADRVYNRMVDDGLVEFSYLEFDFHFLSNGKSKLEALGQTLASNYGYKLQDIYQRDDGLWDLSGVTTPFPVTSDNLIYWSLDLYKRGYEFDTELDGYGASIDKENQSTPEFSKEKSDFYFDLGIDLYNQGNLSGALMQLTNVLEINPEDVDALYSRAIIKNELYASNSAMTDYNKAIELAPDFASALLNRGALKDENKNHLEAIEDYEKVIQLTNVDNETVQRAYFNKGNSFMQLDKMEEACKNWTEAKERGAGYAQERLDLHCGPK